MSDQLKKTLDDYAVLNSLERKKIRFDTMYWDDTDEADIIVKVTAQRMVEMTKYMEFVLDKI